VMFFLDYYGSERRGTVMDRLRRSVAWACCVPALPGVAGHRLTDRVLWPAILTRIREEGVSHTACVPSKAAGEMTVLEAKMSISSVLQAATTGDSAVLRRAVTKLGGFASLLPEEDAAAALDDLWGCRTAANMLERAPEWS